MNKPILTLLLATSTVASARTIITDKPIPGLSAFSITRNEVENIQKKEDREFLVKETMRRFSPLCTADSLIKTAEKDLGIAFWKKVNGAIQMDKYQTYIDMMAYYTKNSSGTPLADATQAKSSLNLLARVNGFSPITNGQMDALRLDGETNAIVSYETPLTLVCAGTIKTKQGDTFTTKIEYSLQWFTKNYATFSGGGLDKSNLESALNGVVNPSSSESESKTVIAAYQKVYASLQACYVKKCNLEPHQAELASKFILGNISGSEAIERGLRGIAQ